MNSDELKSVSKALAVLFSSFPQSAVADIDLQLRAYVDAVKDAHLDDVLSAIDRFRRGEVPGNDGAFCPSAAQLCADVRKHQQVRLARRPVLVKA